MHAVENGRSRFGQEETSDAPGNCLMTGTWMGGIYWLFLFFSFVTLFLFSLSFFWEIVFCDRTHKYSWPKCFPKKERKRFEKAWSMFLQEDMVCLQGLCFTLEWIIAKEKYIFHVTSRWYCCLKIGIPHVIPIILTPINVWLHVFGLLSLFTTQTMVI